MWCQGHDWLVHRQYPGEDHPGRDENYCEWAVWDSKLECQNNWLAH